jgi:serine/threonine protein kinase/formylglycine-generating enzyme required for sulfatase activity
MKYDAGARQAAGASARKRGSLDGAPYRTGDVIAGRYTVRDLIGAGPVGYVFRVFDQTHEIDVALKIINPRLLQEPEERTQFSLVLKVGKKLGHPYLLRVYDEGIDRDRPFFTTQVVEGMTLRRMMEMRAAKGQPFTLKEVEPLLSQLSDALDAAHRYGPHSDIKPENVIVLPDVLKVTDYGLALSIPRRPFAQAQKGYRAEGYIAPEYTSGGEIDSRMDIYSLAVIVGEMLSGLVPDGDGIPEILQKNPDLPPAFEALYRRALNANPLARPRTAGEFTSEFSAIVAKSPGGGGRAARPAAPVASSALAATARASDKPPPPVPTDQLPVPSISPGVGPRAPVPSEAPPPDATQPMDALTMPGGRPTAQSEEPPADATQPMDAEQLAAILAAPPSTVLKPGGLRKVVEARSAAEGRSGKPASGDAAPPPVAPAPKKSASPPPEPRTSPPVAAPEPRAAPAVAAPRPRPRVERRPLSSRWLVLLTLVGLVLGSGAGYLWLKQRGAGQTGSGTLPGTGQEAGSSTSGSGTAGDPMAPAGSCPAGMRLVSGGAFKMGAPSNDRDRGFDEHLLVSVQVPTFCIDEYEYPNKAGALPTVNVSWEEAERACAKAGKRLCTEEEWEKACKGPGNARFPYGNAFEASVCNTDDTEGQGLGLAESGRFTRCRSGYNVADLSGNVAEWTSAQFASSGPSKAQKGGAFNRSSKTARCSARKSGMPTEKEPTVGFRCCAGVQP